MVQICHHHLLSTRLLLHLADVAVDVAVAGAHHTALLALAAPRTVGAGGQVGAGSLVSQLDPRPTRGLLQLARVPVRGPVIAAHVPHLPRTLHAGAGLDLGLAVLEGHLYNLVISGQ